MWQLTDCTVLTLRRNEDDTVSCFCWNAHNSHHIATLWFIIVLAGAMSASSRCSVRFVFFSNSPVEHSSLVGEQHRATGCASWGGSGCTEEHLWYGLPESGQTRTSTSQWYVCPSRLLQQYVYTTWWFFFPTLPSRFMGSQLWWRSTFECFPQETNSFSL